jgi:hypothetical protein
MVRFCGSDPLIANRCFDQRRSVMWRAFVIRGSRPRVGHRLAGAAMVRFCASDPLIANRCFDQRRSVM